jgi:HEPN domain-containing protein
VNLKDWLKNGWLVEHRTSRQEISDLLNVADRDLVQCQVSGLSPDWRLSIAYNAALQLVTAALAAAGYRASKEAHHYRAIQSLAYTLKADKQLIAQLDRFRKKRNITGYERAGVVSEQEAREIFSLAKNLRDEVEKWLRSNHPDLS